MCSNAANVQASVATMLNSSIGAKYPPMPRLRRAGKSMILVREYTLV